MRHQGLSQNSWQALSSFYAKRSNIFLMENRNILYLIIKIVAIKKTTESGTGFNEFEPGLNSKGSSTTYLKSVIQDLSMSYR